MADERVRQDLAAIERGDQRDVEPVSEGNLDALLDLVCEDAISGESPDADHG